MILQNLGLDPTVEYFIWLIIGVIILTLILWLAVRIIVSKTKASDKKWMIILLSILVLIILPLVSGLIAQILNLIAQLPLLLPWGQNYLVQLVPIVEFLLFLVLVKFLISVDWGNALWISLLGLFLLYLLYSFFPVLHAGIGGI
ncbi:MAG: hypothetical protein ACTSRZ_11375 [Promethearchaeota archaeon]